YVNTTFFIFVFLSSTIYTKLDELTLQFIKTRPHPTVNLNVHLAWKVGLGRVFEIVCFGAIIVGEPAPTNL
ncbi:hypothetical protein QUA00_31380, partial [Microcoleus sp. T2B6]|uniref:hypothetical protein n=1 Tax=Microcoleus sp. T2B6 TaxID=3055424 RepID=UPI002FD349CB